MAPMLKDLMEDWSEAVMNEVNLSYSCTKVNSRGFFSTAAKIA
jgi:hypothetical protein